MVTYYQFEEAKVKAVDDNSVFIKVDGKEVKAAYDDQIVTYAMSTPQISEEEYEK